MKKILTLPLLTALLCGSASQAFADIKLGMIAPRGELEATETWTKFAEYLTEKVGEKVILIPIKPDKNVQAVADKQVDLFITNPVISAVINESFKVSLLATLNQEEGSQMAGVIIASKKSGITKAEDLKGKNVLTFTIGKSAAANVFQHYYLKQKGIDVNKDFASYKVANKQDDIVLSVKAGIADAGFIRSGMLETLVKQGKLKMDDVVVIDPKTDKDFTAVHTTPLYPEWYLFAVEGFDAEKAKKVKAAALAVKPTDEAAKTAKIKGFIEPLDLAELTKVLKDVKAPPFDK